MSNIGYIYSIVSKTEGTAYIDSTTREPSIRWYEHKNDLINNNHYNYKFTMLYAHYNMDDFIFTCEQIIEFSDYQELIDIEGIEIRKIPEDWSLNIERHPETGGCFYGRKHTPEENEKNRQAHLGEKGYWWGKIGPNYGIHPSDETREKNRLSNLGEKHWHYGGDGTMVGKEAFLHFPNGKHYFEINGLRFSKEFKLSSGTLSNLITGGIESYKGITGERAPKWLVDKVKPFMDRGVYWVEIDIDGNIIPNN